MIKLRLIISAFIALTTPWVNLFQHETRSEREHDNAEQETQNFF